MINIVEQANIKYKISAGKRREILVKEIDLLFASTSDYLPLIVVNAISIVKNLSCDYKVNLHYLYADIVKPISNEKRTNIFETAENTFKKFDINFLSYDITNLIPLLKGQNIGMWGESISFTHYMYLLAPLVLKDIEKVIFLDADMIVNCDLTEVYNIELGEKLLAMAAPRGMEEMGDDVSNSGFVVLNLAQWRKENILEKLLEFGRQLPKSRFCDQNLLHQYFTLNNPNRLLLVDKLYNIFPQLFYEIPLNEIKILHYTGWNCTAPWKDSNLEQRGSFLWWEYAKETTFYEYFLLNATNSNKQQREKGYSLAEKIFSIKNSRDRKHKILTVLGLKFKIKK